MNSPISNEIHCLDRDNLKILRHETKTSHESKKSKSSCFHTWQDNFHQLLLFRMNHNHCFVPCVYRPNPSLASWAKRQRYQYRLFVNGKKASINLERIKLLESVGFVWNSQKALWQERLRELVSFKEKYGTCDVPSHFPQNQPLATWVKCQRRQYRLYRQRQPSNISHERIKTLEKHGFSWKYNSPTSVKSTCLCNDEYECWRSILCDLCSDDEDSNTLLEDHDE